MNEGLDDECQDDESQDATPTNEGTLKTSPSVELLIKDKWNHFKRDASDTALKPASPPPYFFQFMNYLYDTRPTTARVHDSTPVADELLQEEIAESSSHTSDGDKKPCAKPNVKQVISKKTQDADYIQECELAGESKAHSIPHAKKNKRDFDDSEASTDDDLPPSSPFRDSVIGDSKSHIVSNTKRTDAPGDELDFSEDKQVPKVASGKKNNSVEKKKKKKIACGDSVTPTRKKLKQNPADISTVPKAKTAAKPKSQGKVMAVGTNPKIPKKKPGRSPVLEDSFKVDEESGDEGDEDDDAEGEECLTPAQGSKESRNSVQVHFL